MPRNVCSTAAQRLLECRATFARLPRNVCSNAAQRLLECRAREWNPCCVFIRHVQAQPVTPGVTVTPALRAEHVDGVERPFEAPLVSLV
jgi:hypothetical protein